MSNDDRRERQSAALRANLARRKAQSRARADDSAENDPNLPTKDSSTASTRRRAGREGTAARKTRTSFQAPE